jgi:DNA-binding helix-turn-helix protein
MKKLKKLRLKTKLHLTQVAAYLELSEQSYNDIESDDTQDISFGLIDKLANLYCMNTFDIIEKPIDKLESYIYNEKLINDEIKSIAESNKISLNQLFMEKLLEVKPDAN